MSRVSRTVLVLIVAWFSMANRTSELELVIPYECIIEVHATSKTVCKGPDIDHIICYQMALTYKQGCAHWNIDRKR